MRKCEFFLKCVANAVIAILLSCSDQFVKLFDSMPVRTHIIVIVYCTHVIVHYHKRQ